MCFLYTNEVTSQFKRRLPKGCSLGRVVETSHIERSYFKDHLAILLVSCDDCVLPLVGGETVRGWVCCSLRRGYSWELHDESTGGVPEVFVTCWQTRDRQELGIGRTKTKGGIRRTDNS